MNATILAAAALAYDQAAAPLRDRDLLLDDAWHVIPATELAVGDHVAGVSPGHGPVAVVDPGPRFVWVVHEDGHVYPWGTEETVEVRRG